MAVSDKKHRKPVLREPSIRLEPVDQVCRCATLLPSTSPGTLGMNDSADPNQPSLLGDTPGSLGMNDCGAPLPITLSALKTLHNWQLESDVHLPAERQIAHYFPGASKEQVLGLAYEFVLRRECLKGQPPSNPYVPGTNSGITIGVGYDLGQQEESLIRKDWADLNNVHQPPAVGGAAPGLLDSKLSGNPSDAANRFRNELRLFTPLDRIAHAAKMSHQQSLTYLSEVRNIYIPTELSLKVYREVMLPRAYLAAVDVFPGFGDLPRGAQVALLSLAFNRGFPKRKTKNATFDEAVLDNPLVPSSRWEMKQLRAAIQQKDLVWIYWYFGSMRRVWSQGRNASPGLVSRRGDEMRLIFPYVQADLSFERFLLKHPSFR